MKIIPHDKQPVFEIPGIVHRTIASQAHGLTSVEVWLQTVAPGGATPPHYHACEEVVIVHSGSGRLEVGGETRPFGPGSTLIIPAEAIHRLVNGDDEEMSLTAVLAETPARVFTPDGELLALPWQAS